jgi:hypothetical protein
MNRFKVQAATVRVYDGTRPCLPPETWKTLCKILHDDGKEPPRLKPVIRP